MEVPMQKMVSISVDSKIYPLQAVYAASYTFTDRAYVEVSDKASRKIGVTLTVKNGGALNPSRLKGEFMNELLHHTLRLKIAASNQKIREYIVTQALFSAQPAQEQDGANTAKHQAKQTAAQDEKLEKEIEKLLKEVEKEDYKTDPLGIAVPWEEKFGKAKKQAKSKSPKRLLRRGA